MTDVILISLPADRNPEKVFKELHDGLAKSSASSTVLKFDVPMNIKTETLDKLVVLSDEYQNMESTAESITRKIVHYMADILEEQRDRLEENLLVNGASPSDYVSKFKWDTARFPAKDSLETLIGTIGSILGRIDADLRSKAAAYNSLRNSLQALERKQTGSLLTRNLGDIVKKEQFVQGSEYLITVPVVVQRHAYKEWEATYESLVDMVVPRSTELIFEDQDYGLWTVTLFQKMLNDFAQRAREKKFIVRDFIYDESMIEGERQNLLQARAEKKKQFPLVFRWLKINFGEVFATLVHIKGLRIFVDSIMRYGLPVDFMPAMIKTPRKNVKKLRDSLMNMYQHLDNMATKNTKEDDIVFAGMAQIEYYPYVSINLEIDIDPH
ncbi:hypothetical protein Aperf_G00000074840 [Anoplocephala perfoliata]